ncbi:MAG: T9SS-dependent M36 family metallopeptidase [Bacteroidia bacterium]|nr:T9SS-dependent M36 family metallopeptidase [Bacteroidia bacterium]
MRGLRGCWLLAVLICAQHAAQAQAERQVMEYLGKHAKAWNLTPEDVAAPIVTDQYTSRHSQVTHVYLQQQWNGIPLRQGRIGAHVSADGRMLAFHMRFVPDLSRKAASLQALLSPRQAAQAALQAAGLDAARLPAQEAMLRAPNQYELDAPGLAGQPMRISLQYHADSTGAVSLVWEVEIDLLSGEHWWVTGIDAASGMLRYQEDRVLHCGWPAIHEAHDGCSGTELHEPADGLLGGTEVQTTGTYRVFDYPLESPNHGARTLVASPADPLASPFGWHDTNGAAGAEFTITRGNNVHASEDRNDDNVPGYAPDGGPSLIFDFPLDLSLSPVLNQDAAITNLFYWNNLTHDVWYQYGFDEVSGNFQQNNYGRGGLGSDYVNADAQDGSGTNNANFATPPDGQNPRMQMFLWTSGNTPLTRDLRVNTPASIAGLYENQRAIFGAPVPSSPLTANLVLVQDGTGNNLGCQVLTNPADISGKIAVVDRGSCNFTVKVKNAQDAGAVAVVIFNNASNFIPPGGSDPSIIIPAIMVSQQSGNLIRPLIASGVNVTLQADLPMGLDSDFDNGVIVHEYGHGISTRLTGGPASSGCLFNEEQAGEGWSDWFALVMSVEPGDVGATARGIGTYASGQPVTGGGIRPFPYSTSMSVNPVTYDYAKTLSVPHGVGSVMCSMLWDLYWKLIETYGYDPDIYTGKGGNNMAMQLVIDGLKLQPCGPGFTDVRDAILLADQINYGGANECLIWGVFARRGLGFSADQGSPSSRSDGTQAFDLPPACRSILYMTKSVSPEQIPAGDTLTYTLQVFNNTSGVLTNVTVRDTLPAGVFYVPGSASAPLSDSGAVLVFPLGSMSPTQSAALTFQATVNPSASFSTFLFEDSFEDPLSGPYVAEMLTGTDGWVRDTGNARSGQVAYFIPNAPALNDHTLLLPVQLPDTNTVFSFWHSFDTEGGWDGGLVEVFPTSSLGAWTDLGPLMLENGYNSGVGFNNPAGERDAFSGNSNGYIKTRIDLSPYAGEQIFLRFRFVSDDNTNETGWYIDDIAFGAEVSFLNRACVAAAEGNVWCAVQDAPNIILEPKATTAAGPDVQPLPVKVFPNPARDRVSVVFRELPRNGASLRLLTLQGQEVLRSTAAPGTPETVLDLSTLARGIYQLEVRSGGETARIKLIRE